MLNKTEYMQFGFTYTTFKKAELMYDEKWHVLKKEKMELHDCC